MMLSCLEAELGPEAEGAFWHAYSQTAKTSIEHPDHRRPRSYRFASLHDHGAHAPGSQGCCESPMVESWCVRPGDDQASTRRPQRALQEAALEGTIVG